MIWVLPYYHHLDIIERAKVESVEYQPSRWIDSICAILVAHEIGQRLEIWLVELTLQANLPRLLYAYFHFVLFSAKVRFSANKKGLERCSRPFFVIDTQ